MKRRMNGYLLAGLIVTGLMAALILVGLVWTPYDPDALLAGPKLEGPSLAHWLGTDEVGRDVLARLICGGRVSLLVGFAVYTAGIIGFVGLVIPHMVRILFGTDHKKLIPISALLGAIFLLWSDVLCRVVLPGKEIPIGVLTALVGAPVFIYLMARKKYGFGGGD